MSLTCQTSTIPDALAATMHAHPKPSPSPKPTLSTKPGTFIWRNVDMGGVRSVTAMGMHTAHAPRRRRGAISLSSHIRASFRDLADHVQASPRYQFLPLSRLSPTSLHHASGYIFPPATQQSSLSSSSVAGLQPSAHHRHRTIHQRRCRLQLRLLSPAGHDVRISAAGLPSCRLPSGRLPSATTRILPTRPPRHGPASRVPAAPAPAQRRLSRRLVGSLLPSLLFSRLRALWWSIVDFL